MTVDLAKAADLSDKERTHLELSIYVGYALERAQKFEQAVALIIALSRAQERLNDHESFKDDLGSLMSKHMVQLLARAIELGLITPELAQHCDKARKKRNQFVHGFFRDHDLHTKAGLTKAFWDVQEAHSLFEAVHALLATSVAEMITSLGFTDNEVAQGSALVREMQEREWT